MIPHAPPLPSPPLPSPPIHPASSPPSPPQHLLSPFHPHLACGHETLCELLPQPMGAPCPLDGGGSGASPEGGEGEVGWDQAGKGD